MAVQRMLRRGPCIRPRLNHRRQWMAKKIRPALKELRPEVVVPVDFFGFNRFTARAGRESGAQVLYLVSPQVWASRPGRIAVLKKWVHRMLVIFPFEEEPNYYHFSKELWIRMQL